MSDKDFLIWQNLAWQAEAHLSEFGVRLPLETRMLLAQVRDLSDAMAEAKRKDWISTERNRAAHDEPKPQLVVAGV
ncbi:MAG: hypothetical protein AAGC92_09595 [Pseudomonadota bacterium]